jgi:hypothetical protein
MRSYGVGADGLMSHALGSPDALAGALRDAGFEGVETRTEDSTYTFESVEEWWDRAAGRPQLIHTLGAERTAELRRDALGLAAAYAEEGRVPMVRPVTFAIARKPS